METMYLCGGINGLSDADAKDWREEVKERLAGLYNFLDPMRRDYRGREGDWEVVEEIVAKDLEDIDNSAYLLVMANKPSWGTAMEVHYAWGGKYAKTIVVVCDSETPSPWLQYHSSIIVKTLEEAIHYLELQFTYELQS